jgi:hypothetical protein
MVRDGAPHLLTMRVFVVPHPEERAHPSRPSDSKAVANGANEARVSKDEATITLLF